MTDFRHDGPVEGPRLLLAHGAGAGSDSPVMEAMTAALVAVGLGVSRFEFGYMAARRAGGGRRPPPKAETMTDEYREAVAALDHRGPLVIGGKSMGGRVASLIADEALDAGHAGGLLCLGYPFHPPQRPDRPRTAHLAALRMPTLICQGTRDPFGGPDEVAGYALSDRIEIAWFEDGDHDLKPRKRVTELGHADHLAAMAARVRRWVDGLIA